MRWHVAFQFRLELNKNCGLKAQQNQGGGERKAASEFPQLSEQKPSLPTGSLASDSVASKLSWRPGSSKPSLTLSMRYESKQPSADVSPFLLEAETRDAEARW